LLRIRLRNDVYLKEKKREEEKKREKKRKEKKRKEKKENREKKTREEGAKENYEKRICHDRSINVGTITGAAYLLFRRFWNRGDPVVGILGRSARR